VGEAACGEGEPLAIDGGERGDLVCGEAGRARDTLRVGEKTPEPKSTTETRSPANARFASSTKR
jgi:hypothetical protein